MGGENLAGPCSSTGAISPQLCEQLEWNSLHLELCPGWGSFKKVRLYPVRWMFELYYRKKKDRTPIAHPRSLSSIVRSLISIPDNRTAAIVSGSSSLVTSISFSRDSAALLRAFRKENGRGKEGKMTQKLIHQQKPSQTQHQ